MAETAAEAAYRAALDEIARVKREGGTELRLDTKSFHALDRIPPEVSDIAGLRRLVIGLSVVSDLSPIAGIFTLQELGLNQTAVTNLAPIADLIGLQGLWLARTAVSDLAPITGLTAMRWLDLNQTAVAELDPVTDLTALQVLSFNQTTVHNLTPLARLKVLQRLYLNQTTVCELSPIVGLAALSHLTLQGSAVADLRPIRSLKRLGTIGDHGLSYADIPATRSDAELARLSKLGDKKDRTRQTLAYLNTLPPWPEPYTPKARPDGLPPVPIGALPVPPEQDAALPLIWGEKGFSFLSAQVGADPVTEAVLEDLLPLIEDLRRKGNRHDDLYRLAGELRERATGEISALNMVKLHLSYQKLRRVYVGREARAERFDDEAVTAIAGVLEIVPGVTLADAGVQVLIERQEQERARQVTPEVALAEEQVLASIQANDAPFDPAVQDAARVILLPGMDDRLSASRGILSRNTVIVVLKHVGGAAAAGAVGGPVGNYVYDHSPQLLALAQTMGDDAYFWAQMILAKFKGQYELAMGIAREVTQSGPVRLRRDKSDKP